MIGYNVQQNIKKKKNNNNNNNNNVPLCNVTKFLDFRSICCLNDFVLCFDTL